VDQYGRAGLSCAGLDATCTIVGNTIRGLGPVQNQTQTGVQIRTQAAGVIFDNVISDHFLLGAHGVPQFSVGIFLVYAQPSSNPHLLQQNIFVNNQINVQRVSSAAAF